MKCMVLNFMMEKLLPVAVCDKFMTMKSGEEFPLVQDVWQFEVLNSALLGDKFCQRSVFPFGLPGQSENQVVCQSGNLEEAHGASTCGIGETFPDFGKQFFNHGAASRGHFSKHMGS